MKSIETSEMLFAKAKQVIPGGVNSPVRAFKAVGPPPRFINRGLGSRIVDEDGNEYLDYVASWGPLILGHANPEVLEALRLSMANGTSFGAPTAAEVELAETIVRMVPSIEMVRLVNSGTEAVMSAIRLARGYTGRDKIVKFAGCYHGHSDGLLARAGSGAATLSVPDSMGVPGAVVEQTIVLPYNNPDAVDECFKKNAESIAALVVEPVAGNMGVVPPKDGYLQALRELCSKHGVVLIFDEVITGFRLAKGGAQERFGIVPDLTCLGKIIGGGLPVGAFGGIRPIMECLAPEGGVYQAGTLSGNPLAVAAGLAALRILERDDPYAELERKATKLANGITSVLSDKNIAHTINRVGSMFSLFFRPGPVSDYDDVLESNKDTFVNLFQGMLENGVYIAPSAFEAWFVSAAHTDADLDATIEAVNKSL